MSITTELPVGESSADEAMKAKAARKAARKAAKEAQAAAAPEEEQEAVAAEEDEAKKARKAARKAARAAAEEAADAAEEAAAVEAARKARKAADAAEEAAAALAEAKKLKKRKAAEALAGEEPAAAAPKRRKGEDGAVVDLSVEAFRKAHEIILWTSGCPDPLQSFASAQPLLGEALSKALLAQGYEAPTPIQAQAWPIVLKGRDMVGVAKTGSGKTCGFLLPALARILERGPAPTPKRFDWHSTEPAKPTVLVLAPTRELCQQIAGEAVKFAPVVNAKVCSVYGGVPKVDQLRALRLGCDVLIATPGRLLDLAQGQPAKGLKPNVSLEDVCYLVLDEADKMLDMGFEEDMRAIVEQCKPIGEPSEGGGATGPKAGTKRQTLFFTATWPKDVQATAKSLTSSSAVQVNIGQGAGGDKLTANKSIEQRVLVMREGDKVDKLREVLDKELKEGETGLVFCMQKVTCNQVERDLMRNVKNMWCKAIHSGREQWERDGALQEFRELTATPKKGQKAVLVATDVASRGLDIPGVALVVVYDFGKALHSAASGVESYVHRIGRTGRAGRKGKAITFFTNEDAGGYELIELLQGAEQIVPQELKDIAEDEAYDRWEKKRKNNRSSWGKGSKGKGKGKGKGKDKGKASGKGKGGGRGFGG